MSDVPVYVLIGTNGVQPAEITVGDVLLSEERAEEAVEELESEPPYDHDANPYWDADEDAPFRKWGFPSPRAHYDILERELHNED